MPTDDAFVRSNRPEKLYGGAHELRVRRSSSADFNTYLKFHVDGLDGSIIDATLRMYVIDPGPEGGEVYLASNHYADSNTPWQEDELNYTNAPPIEGSPISVAEEAALDEIVEFDVTPAIDGNGVYTLALSNKTSDKAAYSSKEGVVAPELVVVTGEANGALPVISGFSPASGSVGEVVTVSGENFSDVTAVSFSGVAASFSLESSTQILAIVPVGASTGAIEVSNSSGTASSASAFVVNTSNFTSATFQPIDDSFVRSVKPDNHYGSHDDLRVRQPHSDDVIAYLKFNVTGLSGAVQTAVLRLMVMEPGVDGGTLFLVGNEFQGTNTPWNETDLTFNTAPPITGDPLGSAGSVASGDLVEFDVTGVVNGSGVYSFAIRNEANDLVKYSSKEGLNPPELFVEAGGGSSPDSPSISGFTPTSGLAGTSVTIFGENFTGASSVSFNGQTASFTANSSTQITAVVPASATMGKISVTTPDGTAISPQDFVVLNPPSISSFTPVSGAVGTEVTIIGSNFTSVTSVAFNGATTNNYVVDSASQLRATVPVGASDGPISVSTAVGTALSAGHFTVTQASDPPSTIVSTPTDDSFVRSNRPDRVYGHSDELRVRDTSSADYFTYMKFSVAGSGGLIEKATLRLLVTDEGLDGGSFYLAENEFAGSATPWNEQELVFDNAPLLVGGALQSIGPVNVGDVVEIDVSSVVNSDGFYTFAIQNNSSDLVTYSSKEGSQAPELLIETAGNSTDPYITGFTPTAATEGSVVTIIGGNFSAVNNVVFNGVATSAFVVDSETQLRATVPAGASSGKISVITSEGTATSADDFLVLAPPSISSFLPDSGPPGTEVTINGQNLQTVTVVSFNGTAASFDINSDSRLTAIVPIGSSSGAIQVSNTVGSAVSGAHFTVTEPTGPSVLSLTPIADSFVRSNKATKIYGDAHELRVRNTASAEYYTFLKFEVLGLAEPVQTATLRLYVINDSPDGGSVYSVSNNLDGSNEAWTEDNLVWNNAPPVNGSQLSSQASIHVGEVVEFDVTDAISGNGTYSFALKNNSSDLANYSSKEGAQAPELLIHTGEPPSLTPTISTFSPSSGGVGMLVTIIGSNFGSDSDGLDNSGQIKIMPLGDSITQGLHGSTDNAGYRNDLAELLDAQGIDYDFVGTKRDGSGFDRDHEGHSGFRADELLAELNSYLNSNPPDMILLHIGTNDISELQTVGSTIDEIEIILEDIRGFDPDIVIILASIVPRTDRKDDETSDLNALIRDLAADKQAVGYNLVYAGMNEAFRENPNWENAYLDDSVHPNDTGYAVMAGVWFDAIVDALSGSEDIEVAFNGVPASTVFVDSDTRLRAAVPSGGSTGKISVSNFFGIGFSAADFVVTSGTSSVLSFVNPTGGETWQPGSTHVLNWRSEADVDRVNMAYSSDGGESWSKLAENLPNTGKFVWSLPEAPADDLRVRISDAYKRGTVATLGGSLTLGKATKALQLPSLKAMTEVALGEREFVEDVQSGDLDQDGDIDVVDLVNMIDLNVDYGRIAFKTAPERKEKTTINVSAAEARVAGDSLIVPIEVASNVPVRGFQLKLEFSGDVEWLAAAETTNPYNMLTYSRASGSSLHVVGYLKKENASVNIGGILLNVIARPRGAIEAPTVKVAAATFVDRYNRPLEVEAKSQDAATELPTEFQLLQNYPNPFNLTTHIQFHLPQKSEVRLQIYNLRGELVRTLLDEEREPGKYKIAWDGRNDQRRVVASGIYVYRIKAGNWEEARRLTLLK